MRLRLALPAAIAVLSLAAACTSGKHRRSPHAPTLVTAVGGNGTITVSWADAPYAADYVLYYARESGVSKTTFQDLLDGGRSSGVTSPVNFDQAQNGETWFFVVTAVSKDGYESEDSQQVYASATPWPEAIVIGQPDGDALTGDLAADAAGNLIAVWSRQHPNRYTIQASRYSVASQSWTTPAGLDSDAGFSYSARVDTRPNGTAMATWRQGQGVDDAIWMNVYTGGSWTTPLRVTTNGVTGAARNPDVTATGNGGAFVLAWAQFDGVGENVYGTDWNSGFGPTAEIDGGAPDADFPRLAGDAAGNATAVFTQDGRVWYADYLGGSGWQTAQVLSLATNGATSPAIAMNGAGDAVAVWREPNPAGFDMWAAVRTGASWDAPIRLEEAAGTVGAPAVAISNDGSALVVFAQRVGLHDVLQADRYVDGAWQGSTRIDNDDTGDVKEVSVAVDDNTRAIALWTQEVVGPGGTSKNVYSNRYSVTDSSWRTAVLASPFGLNSNPSVVIGSNGVATGLWTWLTASGTAVMSNKLPLP